MSSERSASLPSASRSAACCVFFAPSFMPLPLNAGARSEDGAGDAVRTGVGALNSRWGTGE